MVISMDKKGEGVGESSYSNKIELGKVALIL